MEQRMADAWGGEICTQSAASTSRGRWWLQGWLTVVHCDHMQAVQKLSLILVDPLHMHVKHGWWVDLHFVLLLQKLRKLQLVLLLRQGTGPELFWLRSIGWSVFKKWSINPQWKCCGKDPHREASPASRWKFPGGRHHHPGSCVTLSAGSSLSRSLPQFSFSLKEEVILIRDGNQAQMISFCHSVASACAHLQQDSSPTTQYTEWLYSQKRLESLWGKNTLLLS